MTGRGSGRDLVRRFAVIAAATALGLAGLLVPAAPAAAETVREAQWHLRSLDVAAAQKITKGSGVVVAIVDTGVEANHPDLSGQILPGKGFGTGIGAPDGRVDTDGHGTDMAGLIVAKGGGENHALGLAPAAKVLPVRISADGENTNARDTADGIRWAADRGAKVINISLGSDRPPVDFEREAVEYALSKDAVVVVAAGNRTQGQDVLGSYALIPGVLVVTATGRTNRLWSGSTTGAAVGIAAPGDTIVSTGSRAAGSKTGYVTGTGTSSATAIVSGAAALIRARYPQLKAPDVINRLIRTADDAGPAGRDPEYGFGVLDVKSALTADVPHVDANPLGAAVGATAGPSLGADSRPNPFNGRAIAGFAIIGCVLLTAIVVPIIIVVASRRRRRRPVAVGPYPPGQYPPSQYPPGPPPPGQYPPPSQYPPGPHQQGQPPPPGQR